MGKVMLEEEQRHLVRDCLRKSGLSLVDKNFSDFIAKIELSIAAAISNNEDEPTERKRRDMLRTLWLLADQDDPPVGQIRVRIAGLPNAVMNRIDMRAQHIIPRLEAEWKFRQVSLSEAQALGRHQPPLQQPDLKFLKPLGTRTAWISAGGFREWAITAPADLLLDAIKCVVAQGGKIVKGRSRGAGKRAPGRLEPVIEGIVRGEGSDRSKGGSPRAQSRDQLVMHLALDWLSATGAMPGRGRSDHTGFGDLVHKVFGWAGDLGASGFDNSHQDASYALRKYWDALDSIQARIDNKDLAEVGEFSIDRLD
jgi:hypothetical protein